jgi:hypothetical protein
LFSHAVIWQPQVDDRADHAATGARSGPEPRADPDGSAAAARAAGTGSAAAVRTGPARARGAAKLEQPVHERRRRDARFEWDAEVRPVTEGDRLAMASRHMPPEVAAAYVEATYADRLHAAV